jgi:excisionase family DNA binding protein
MDAASLTAQQVADRYGVAEKTVRRWIESGRLAAEKRGRAFAISPLDAESAFRATRAGRLAGREAALEERLREAESEALLLKGRYLELQDRVQRLEQELEAERSRRLRLELRLGQAA